MRERSALATIAIVGIVAAVSAAIVGASWEFGRDRIAANERARRLASLNSVLDERHLGDDVDPVLLSVDGDPLLGSESAVDVFVPMRNRRALAMVFSSVAPGGYNGPIALLVGIDCEAGTITGVRTVSHKETPGLGDLIEIRKSPWIRQFDDRSLSAPESDGWRVRQEGGEFDAITGATVTPRAVIDAVHNTLLYFDANREALIAAARSAENRSTQP